MFPFNTVCDQIRDVISCCVRSCDTGKINVYHWSVIENEEIWKLKKCLLKPPC